MLSRAFVPSLALITFLGLTASAHADTVCVGASCTVTIAQSNAAPTSNFQTPSSNAQVGYTIVTSDDGTNFHVVLSTSDPNALEFSNLYFDTIASTPGTGSNLGFEFGPSTANDDAFDPNSGVKYNLSGTGVTALFSQTALNTSAMITIPNTFFLTNPLMMPFADTPAGTLVSLHLSQTFSYSVVGGSANFPAPVELGDAIVGNSAAVTPEPSSVLLLASGMLCLGGMVVKRVVA